MIDIQAVMQNSEIIKTAIHTCTSLKESSRIRTSLNPGLLHKVIATSINCPEKPDNFKLDLGVMQGSQLHSSICLTSGGADSTIFWYKLGKPKGLYIDIGQSYASREEHALHELGVDYYKVSLIDQFNIQTHWYNWKHIIPGRNFLFLTIAAELVKDNGKIHIGILEGEGFNSDKGDKSQKFLTEFEDWYSCVSGKTVVVSTMEERTKPGWLEWFSEAGYSTDIVRKKTITCFEPLTGKKRQCGRCQACLRKYLSFVNIGEDIKEDFETHPMVGANVYVKKYLTTLKICLKENDFTHYSQKRCIEDLEAIEVATEWLRG